MRSALIVAGVAVLLATAVSAQREPPRTVDADPVCMINGQPIARAEFDRELLRRYGPVCVKQLLLEELVRQKARERNVEVSDEEVRRAVEQSAVERNIRTLGAWAKFLNATYPAMEFSAAQKRYEEDMRLQLMIEKIVEPDVEVKDEEVQDFYQKHPDSPLITQPEARSCRVIVVNEEDLAKQIHARVSARPATFPDEARKHSQDWPTADKGGDFGRYIYKPAGEMNEFEQAVFRTKMGEVAEPFKSPFPDHKETGMWMIVRVDDVRPGRKYEYEEIKDEIKAEMLRLRRQAKAQVWMSREAWYTDDGKPINEIQLFLAFEKEAGG